MEFSWILVFGLGISKWCNIILQNFPQLFNFENVGNGPTEKTASDSLKIDVTKILISQELKHITNLQKALENVFNIATTHS